MNRASSRYVCMDKSQAFSIPDSGDNFKCVAGLFETTRYGKMQAHQAYSLYHWETHRWYTADILDARNTFLFCWFASIYINISILEAVWQRLFFHRVYTIPGFMSFILSLFVLAGTNTSSAPAGMACCHIQWYETCMLPFFLFFLACIYFTKIIALRPPIADRSSTGPLSANIRYINAPSRSGEGKNEPLFSYFLAPFWNGTNWGVLERLLRDVLVEAIQLIHPDNNFCDTCFQHYFSSNSLHSEGTSSRLTKLINNSENTTNIYTCSTFSEVHKLFLYDNVVKRWKAQEEQSKLLLYQINGPAFDLCYAWFAEMFVWQTMPQIVEW